MVSAIDATKPIDGIAAEKADQRANWAAAKSEIEALQAAAPGGDIVVSDITGGVDGQLVGFDAEGAGEAVNGDAYLNPPQVTAPQKAAGTGTTIKSWAEIDVKDMIDIHAPGGGSGGGGGLVAIPNTSTAVPIDHDDFGVLHDLTAATSVTVTLDAQAIVPASIGDERRVGLRRMGAGVITVIMESGSSYFTAGSNTSGTGATASFQVTGYAWAELLRNVGGNSAVWLIGGDTNLPKTVNGPITFVGPVTMVDASLAIADVSGLQTELDAKHPAELADLEKTASFTFALTDAKKMTRGNHATVAITATVPANATVAFPIGTCLNVARWGAAAVTIAAAGGVTINKPASKTFALAEQYAVVQLWKQATNTWLAFGGLASA